MLRSIETTHVVWPFCCLDFASKDPSPSQDGGGSPRMPIHKFCQIIHFAIQRNPTSVTQISKLLLNMSWMDGPRRRDGHHSSARPSLHEFPSKYIHICSIQNIHEHSRIANASNHLQPLQGEWQSSGMQCLATSEMGKFLVMAAWGAWNDLGQDTRTYW